MEFTGERMIPEFNRDQEIYLKHLARYIFASQFVRGKTVLDIACGSGFGSLKLVESGASKVIGMDIDTETIEYCKKKYERKNLEFEVGDVKNIPLPNHSVDIIISFETLEHVTEAEQEVFLKEIKRVLKPRGMLVISTPNTTIPTPKNEFHKKELTPVEFKDFLGNAFKSVQMLYQDNFETSIISVEGGGDDPSRQVIDFIDEIDYSNGMFLVSICCDVESEVAVSNNFSVSKIRTWDYSVEKINLLMEKVQLNKDKRYYIRENEELVKECGRLKNENEELRKNLSEK